MHASATAIPARRTLVTVARNPEPGRVTIHIPDGRTVTYAGVSAGGGYVVVTHNGNGWGAPQRAATFDDAARIASAAVYGEIIPL